MSLFQVRSKEPGHSVHALEFIPAGTELCKFAGKPIYFEETLELGPRESFAFQVGKDLYLYLDEPYCYFNHCCEPNCGVMPDLSLVSLKDIQKNEELRWDYSTSMLEHHWTMKCSCHKKNCRKVIGDFTMLPKRTQEFYLQRNVVQDFIVKMLKGRKKFN